MSFSETRTYLLFCLIPLIVLPGCRRDQAPVTDVIAVLPFENLSPGREADWIGTALTAVARYELMGAAGGRAVLASTVEDASAAGARTIVSGYFETRGGAILIHSFVESPAAHKVRTAVEGSYTADSLVAAATAIARSVTSGRLRPFPETREAALRNWSEASAQRDPKVIEQLLQKALDADPNFGPAYVGLLRLRSMAGDRAAVEQLATRARGAKLGEAEKAEIDYLAALAGNDTNNREQAATAVLEHAGGDAEKLIEFGLLAYRSHEYASAARFYGQVTRLDPKNSTIWNQLAYAQAFAGDKAGAEEAIRHWAAADPTNPNVDDSAGDIEFYFGSFPAAEEAYLRANKKNPAFLGGGPLLKAAWARLMTGDVNGADALMARYAAVRKSGNDPRIGFVQAQWLYISGRKQQAVSGVQGLFGQPAVAAVAHAQAAMWEIGAGSMPEARAQAQQAFNQAGTDGSARVIAAIAAFLCQPEASAAQWKLRAEKVFPGPQLGALRDTALAYALLLGHHPREAVPVLRGLVAAQEPARAGAEVVLLAAALIDSGSPAEAKPLLEKFPIPPNDGISVFAWLHFPRLFALRAKVLGNNEEGRRSLEIYRKLSQ